MNLTEVPVDERKLNEHLTRASELLRGDKLAEAETEIDSALKMRPEDLRARNLRGLFLFRASRYEEARSVYLDLSKGYPDDAALRLNLGLVELRMGRHLDAAHNLKRVIAVEPDNQRAQGYLGLALMRAGEFKAAKDAFEKGGQPELARQVEERMAQADEALAARGDLRRAAEGAARVMEGEQPFAAVELDTPNDEARRGGSWQVRLPGERMPLPAAEGLGPDAGALPLIVEPSKPVSQFATERLLRPGTGEPFALAEGGILVIRCETRLPTRTFGAIASSGLLTFEPLMRRVKGSATEESFGEGGAGMFLAVGNGVMVVAPRGARFTLLALSDDIVYVREPNVFAFEESMSWENGRLPGAKQGDEGNRIVQFRGNGRVVLRSARASFTLKVEKDAPLIVEATALVGWIGRVVPKVLHLESGEPSPYVEASGEGVLILEEPSAA
jgi:Flp pilus assembly protein TadD